MTKEQIINGLKPIIKTYVRDIEAFANISEDSHLLEDLKIISANLVEVIIEVEDFFDIEIDDDAAEQMLTVGAAVKIIKERIKK